MTQKEKDTVFKDICGRLPYGVKIICKASKISLTLTTHMLQEIEKDNNRLEWKPVLRPLSHMTEQEKYAFRQLEFREGRIDKIVDFFNSRHLDYRNLHRKDLAVLASKKTYDLKNLYEE